MRLGRASAFGLAAMVFLGDQPVGSFVSTEAIAEATGAPIEYLRKILPRLGRSTLIASGRGRRGGFCLAQSASRINLLQIIEAINGPVRETTVLNGPAMGRQLPAVDRRLKRCRRHVTSQLHSLFAQMSLADMLDG